MTVWRVTVAALRRQPRALARLAGWSAAEAGPALLSGYATARAVDSGFLAGAPRTGLAWLGLLAAAVVVGALGTRQCFRCLGLLVEPFRDHLLRLVTAAALRRSTAPGARPDTAVVSRLSQQVEVVRDTFAGLVMVVRGFAFSATAALLGVVSLSPAAALLVGAPLAAGVLAFTATLRAMVGRQRTYVLAGEALAAGASAAFAGLRDVAACRAEDQVAAAVGRHVDAQAGAERGLAWMAAVRSITLAVGGWLPLVLVLAFAPWLAGQGLTAGAILGTLVYILHGIQPALDTLLRGLGGGGLRFAVTLHRLLEASRDETPPPTRPVGREDRQPVSPHPAGPRGYRLDVRAVTFSYGRWAEPVLRDLDLVVPEDDHLVVVGPSGIGKSTLAGLLAGTLRPQAGHVRLGGVPLDRIDPADLATRRVLIPQEAYLFTGTLADNLTYLCPGASPARLREAADALGLWPLVERLGGFSASVAPDGLSAGERQLVALARAYLFPARLTLLDEATCYLDPAAESIVEHAFAQRPGSLLVIAHRVSSALRARRVLLLDGAEAVLGSHDEVLAGSRLYRDLVGHWEQPAVRSTPTPERSAPPRSGSELRSSR